MKPEHLLAQEQGAIYRQARTRLSVALVFPNSYEVGMANLGFQTVYRLFNEMDGVRCERVFLWRDDPEVRSFESGRQLREFDVVAFSLSFELDYPNVAGMLQRAGIPLRAVERGKVDPLVMAGGVGVTLNPEPLAPIIDAFVIGESEEVIPALTDQLLQLLPESASRPRLLKSLARIPGVYVPCFYDVEYSENGCIRRVIPSEDVPAIIQRQFVSRLDSAQTFSPIVSPHSHFQDMFLLETGRGCGRGCRFCAAGFIYRPLRFRSREQLWSCIESQDKRWNRVGLIGSAVSDHPDLETLCAGLADRGMELGLSSLRADVLTPGLLESLVRSGMRTVTIAPEAGSEDMRRRLHKNLNEAQIMEAVRLAADQEVTNLKLYFIVGFPFEEEQEIADILRLVDSMRGVFFRKRSKRRTITVSVHPFVPKASTPLQWSCMENEATLDEKLSRISRKVRDWPGVHMTSSSARTAALQGIFSLGDRRVAEGLCLRTERRLSWKMAWRHSGITPGFFAQRERPFEEILPWEIIDTGLSRTMLWDEYRKALESPS